MIKKDELYKRIDEESRKTIIIFETLNFRLILG